MGFPEGTDTILNKANSQLHPPHPPPPEEEQERAPPGQPSAKLEPFAFGYHQPQRTTRVLSSYASPTSEDLKIHIINASPWVVEGVFQHIRPSVPAQSVHEHNTLVWTRLGSNTQSTRCAGVRAYKQNTLGGRCLCSNTPGSWCPHRVLVPGVRA